MAAIILIFAGVVVWLEVGAMKRIGRQSLRDAQTAHPVPSNPNIEDRLARTAGEIAELLELQACWFEPFPFDALASPHRGRAHRASDAGTGSGSVRRHRHRTTGSCERAHNRSVRVGPVSAERGRHLPADDAERAMALAAQTGPPPRPR